MEYPVLMIDVFAILPFYSSRIIGLDGIATRYGMAYQFAQEQRNKN
jgi:hypothetical protein